MPRIKCSESNDSTGDATFPIRETNPEIKCCEGFYVGEHVEILAKTSSAQPKDNITTYIVKIISFCPPFEDRNHNATMTSTRALKKTNWASKSDRGEDKATDAASFSLGKKRQATANDLISCDMTAIPHSVTTAASGMKTVKKRRGGGGNSSNGSHHAKNSLSRRPVFIAQYYYNNTDLPQEIQDSLPIEKEHHSREIYSSPFQQEVSVGLILRKCTVVHSVNSWCWKDVVIASPRPVLKPLVNKKKATKKPVKQMYKWRVEDGIFLCRYQLAPWAGLPPLLPYGININSLDGGELDMNHLERAVIPPLQATKEAANNNSRLVAMSQPTRRQWNPQTLPDFLVHAYLASFSTLQYEVGNIVFAWNKTSKQDIKCVIEEYQSNGCFRVSFANRGQFFIAQFGYMRGFVTQDEALLALSEKGYDCVQALAHVKTLIDQRQQEEQRAALHKNTRREKTAAASKILKDARASRLEPAGRGDVGVLMCGNGAKKRVNRNDRTNASRGAVAAKTIAGKKRKPGVAIPGDHDAMSVSQEVKA